MTDTTWDYIYIATGILAILTVVLFLAGIVMLIIKRNKYWGGLLAAWCFFSPLVLLKRIRRNTYKKWWISLPLMIFSPLTLVCYSIFCFLMLCIWMTNHTANFAPPDLTDVTSSFSFAEYRSSKYISELTSISFPAVVLVDSMAECNVIQDCNIRLRYKSNAPFSQKLIKRIENDSNWTKNTDHFYFRTLSDSTMAEGMKEWSEAEVEVSIFPEENKIEVSIWGNINHEVPIE